MTTGIPMREIARIGKSILVPVIGVAQTHKKEFVAMDDSQCRDCPFHDIPGAMRETYCASCDVQKKTVYVNEKRQYKLYAVKKIEEKRLSKYQLLQFLLYHFFSIDEHGFIRYVSIKQVADILGCNVRTVKNNNEVLAHLGLIAYARVDAEYINVFLPEYRRYHASKEDGGAGYLQVSKEFMMELLQMKQVNSIRLALRGHLHFDNEVSVRKQEKCVYSYRDMKRYMPKNISYRKILLHVMKPTETVFDIDAKESVVVLKLKDTYNGKLLKEEKENAFTQEISAVFQNAEDLLLPAELSDLVQMSMEYGIDAVIQALVQYQNEFADDSVRNLGGFIRTMIRANIHPGLTHPAFETVA